MQFVHTLKSILKSTSSLLICGVLFLMMGCGAGSGKNKNSQDPLAEYIPEWTSITYTSGGSLVTLQPPFITTQSITGDSGTGSCTGNSVEVTLTGIYNAANVTSLTLTGLSSTNNSSAGTFVFVACMPPGSASITITAYDSKSVAIRSPLTVSLYSMTPVNTLGLGHPRYPNTGVAIAHTTPVSGALTSGSTTLVNVSINSIGSNTTASTGNTGYTMETGTTNYIKQLSP